jgi:hypothetical protein
MTITGGTVHTERRTGRQAEGWLVPGSDCLLVSGNERTTPLPSDVLKSDGGKMESLALTSLVVKPRSQGPEGEDSG